jgi:hypothetical protein
MSALRHVVSVAVLTIAFSTAAQAPNGGPGGGGPHHGPPPEALAACQGKSAGTTCSWSHDGRTMEGTCFTPASDKPLACRPNGAPPPGGEQR